MTDKEFKRLRRHQLMDIIYELQTREEELTAEVARLQAELDSKRIRMENAGSIAGAALELNDVFMSAQNAADQYLAEIKIILEETEAERQRIMAVTKKEASRVL